MNKEKLYTEEDMFKAIQYLRTNDKTGKSVNDLHKEIDHHLSLDPTVPRPITFIGTDKNTTERNSFELTYIHPDGTPEVVHILYTEEVYETKGVYEITREEFSYSNGFDKRIPFDELTKLEEFIYREIKSFLPF